MNFVIAAGGTGGHLFPGIAVAEVLRDRGHGVMLIISEKQIDSLAVQGCTGLRIEKMPGIGLQRKNPAELVRFLLKFNRALADCGKLYAEWKPEAVLGMGGFTSFAPILAGRRTKLRTYVHDSNAYPGRSNRLNGRFATSILLGFKECAQYFPGRNCIVTGTPIRAALGTPLPKAEALARFGLQPGRKTVLVMGGSQGARGVNDAVKTSLAALKDQPVQFIHLAGSDDELSVREAYAAAGIPAFVAAFHHDMQAAYSAADLAISRSGAASLTELSAFGLASILIPYPFAADDHQTLNGRIFERAGAALMIAQKSLSGGALTAPLRELIENTTRLREMSEAALKLAPNQAAERIAGVLLQTPA